MLDNSRFAKTSFPYYDTAVFASAFIIRDLLKKYPSLKEIVFMALDYSDAEIARLVAHLDELHDAVEGVLGILPDPYPNPPNWVSGVVPRMPVFSILTFKSTAKGIANVEKELVARRLSARPSDTRTQECS